MSTLVVRPSPLFKISTSSFTFETLPFCRGTAIAVRNHPTACVSMTCDPATAPQGVSVINRGEKLTHFQFPPAEQIVVKTTQMTDHSSIYQQIAWASNSPTKNFRLPILTTVEITAMLSSETNCMGIKALYR